MIFDRLDGYTNFPAVVATRDIQIFMHLEIYRHGGVQSVDFRGQTRRYWVAESSQ
jgi:hypothetical protein